MAIERACAGERDVTLTSAERRAAVARLHATGLSDGAIAHRLGTSTDSVRGHRQHLHLPANTDQGAT